jgi:putative inorganic carbon (hco3(-)) transporter
VASSTIIAIVVFVLYSNAAVVLARYFGLPSAVGALPGLALLLLAAHRVLVRGDPVRLPAALVAASLFGLIGLLSAAQSSLPVASLASALSFVGEGLLLAILVVNAVRDRAEVRAALSALVLAGGAMGALALLHQIGGAEADAFLGFSRVDAAMTADDGRVQRRLAGPVGETNRFAQIMAVVLPLALTLGRQRSGQRWRRRLYLACLVCTGAGLALTFSRGALVALALSAPVAVLLGFLRLRQLFIAAALVGVAALALPQLGERLQSIGAVALQAAGLSPGDLRAADGASRGRLTEMRAAGLIFLEHPLIGAGPGMAPTLYPEYAMVVGGKVRATHRQAHNLYLEAAAETGLAGAMALLTCLALTANGLLKLRERSRGIDSELYEIAGGLLLALILLLMTSLFLHASFIRYFWVLIGLCLAATRLRTEGVLGLLLDRLFRGLAGNAERLQ